jgi:hypothetical protein
VRNLIDFVEAIKDLADTSGGSPCGTLGDFIVTNAYSSSFSVSPSVSVSGTNLVFAVTGTYALTLVGASSPFVSVTMPAFSVPIPRRRGGEPCPRRCSPRRFALDLLNQPDKIAMFLAMVVGPQAARVALELVCNWSTGRRPPRPCRAHPVPLP